MIKIKGQLKLQDILQGKKDTIKELLGQYFDNCIEEFDNTLIFLNKECISHDTIVKILNELSELLKDQERIDVTELYILQENEDFLKLVGVIDKYGFFWNEEL